MSPTHAASLLGGAANALTVSRFFMAVVLVTSSGNLRLWLVLIIGAAITDVLDGPLARRAHDLRNSPPEVRATSAGTWLDPLCDKLFVFALLWSLYLATGVPGWWLWLIIARELVQSVAVMTYRVVAHLGRRPAQLDFRAGAPGKATTLLQFLSVMLIASGAEQGITLISCVLTGVVGLYAAVYYIRRATLGPDPHAELLLHESPIHIVGRRLVTVPALLVAAVASVCLTPVAVPVLLVVDALRSRDRRFALCRGWLALLLNLCMHVAALIGLSVLGLAGSLMGPRKEDLIFRFEIAWARAMYRALEALYQVTTTVAGLDAISAGPVVVMARHCSLVDPLLLDAITASSGLHLRHVAKTDLIWDPAIDVLSHQVPMAFVKRGGAAHDADIAAVQRMGQALGDTDGVLIFPEGTRFTEAKRQRILAGLAHRHPELHDRASALTHVLPPHPAGALALLQAHTDVVFCAHTGLEGIRTMAGLASGALVGRTIEIELWRVAHADIPEDRDAQIAWLLDRWTDVERWVAAHQAEPPAAAKLISPGAIHALTLVLPPLLVVLAVAAIGVGLGEAAALELAGLLGATFFALGKLVILTPAHHPAFTPLFLAIVVLLLDLLTAVVVVYNLDWLYRIGSVGKKLEALQREGEFIVSITGWMRQLTTLAVAAFVTFPMAMTGAVGAAVFGRLLGLSRTRTMLGIFAGSLTGCALMLGFARALAPLFNAIPSGYRTVAGAAFALSLVAALNWRYRRLRRDRSEGSDDP